MDTFLRRWAIGCYSLAGLFTVYAVTGWSPWW